MPNEQLPVSSNEAAFTMVMRGYDKNEVDSHFERKSEEIQRLEQERENALAAADLAHQRVGERVGALLQYAHDWAEEVRSEAEVEAQRITERVRDHARRIEEAAARRAEETLLEADHKARRSIGQAEDLVQELHETQQLALSRIVALKSRLIRVVEQLDESEKQFEGEDSPTVATDALSGPSGLLEMDELKELVEEGETGRPADIDAEESEIDGVDMDEPTADGAEVQVQGMQSAEVEKNDRDPTSEEAEVDEHDPKAIVNDGATAKSDDDEAEEAGQTRQNFTDKIQVETRELPS
jgi:hypothetical protein